MLNIFISVIGILVTIFLVVGVHELGHFIIARLSGIKVLRFSIGFGKVLYRWHDKQGTEYAISALPLGGYVKMLDDKEDTVAPEDLHLSFNHQPFYKKFAVIAAGPFFNLLFAFIIYTSLFLIGFTTFAPTIGNVTPHSIADEAGLKPSQEIIKIDNKPTHSWTAIIINLLSRAGDQEPIKIQVKNAKQAINKDYVLNVTNWHIDSLKPDLLKSIGIEPFEPIVPAIIGKLLPHSPAEKAGLKVSDEIIAINNKPIKDWAALVSLIIDHPHTNFLFTLKRDNKILTLPVMVGVKHNISFHSSGYLGMSPNFKWPPSLLRENKYGLGEAISHAWNDVVLYIKMNFIVFGKMLSGKISLQSLGGPISIFESAGTALNNGMLSFLSFLAFLSISIGIINVIPIPGLDGGHLLFQAIESVIGRPLSDKTLYLLYRFGFIFLVLVMFQALVNDILRL